MAKDEGLATGLKAPALNVWALGIQVYGNINGTDESEITLDVM